MHYCILVIMFSARFVPFRLSTAGMNDVICFIYVMHSY